MFIWMWQKQGAFSGYSLCLRGLPVLVLCLISGCSLLRSLMIYVSVYLSEKRLVYHKIKTKLLGLEITEIFHVKSIKIADKIFYHAVLVFNTSRSRRNILNQNKTKIMTDFFNDFWLSLCGDAVLNTRIFKVKSLCFYARYAARARALNTSRSEK